MQTLTLFQTSMSLSLATTLFSLWGLHIDNYDIDAILKNQKLITKQHWVWFPISRFPPTQNTPDKRSRAIKEAILKQITKSMANLNHTILIICLWRSNTLPFKTLVALQEACIEFCHGRKSENLKLVHSVLTSGIQCLTELCWLILICHYEILINLDRISTAKYFRRI